MFSPFCLSVLTLWSVLPGLIIYFIPKCASQCWDSMDCMGMSQPLEMNKSFMEAPTCCVCTWRAERGCVGVYPPGPRAAAENHRDICVNFLFLACFIFFFFFFLAVLLLSPDLLHVLTWPWKGGFSNCFASKRKRSWQAFIFQFLSYVG